MTVSFTAQSDWSAVDVAAGFRYAFATDPAGLQGETYAGRSPDPSSSYSFSGTGDRVVVARILDKDDGYTDYEIVIPAYQGPPVPRITSTPPAGDTGSVAVAEGTSVDLGSIVSDLAVAGPSQGFAHEWIVRKHALGGAATEAVDQYARTVIAFSSQYSDSDRSARQATGAPDTFGYGDLPTAWAPDPINGTIETLTLGFATPVYADGVVIRQNLGSGSVVRVDVLDLDGNSHTAWAGVDPSVPGDTPTEFLASWSRTTFLVIGVKIFIDTDHDPENWEEIDSVQLRSWPPPARRSRPAAGRRPASRRTTTASTSLACPSRTRGA